MHRGVCGCVRACLYKYTSLFHLVDSYLTERNSNITAPLRTNKAITQYVYFIKHSSILPQQSAVLSNASSDFAAGGSIQNLSPILSEHHTAEMKKREIDAGESAPCREPGFALIEGWLTRPSALWSSAWRRTGAVGVQQRVCCILCIVAFVYLCLYVF